MDNKKGIEIVLTAIMIASIFALIAPTAVMGGTESEADKMLSKMDARNLVISQVLNGNTEGKLVYVNSEPVKTGTIIESWYSSIELPQKEGWFFFVDDDPWANWEHPCRYVFVDLTGKTTIYKATTPPNNLMELERMVGFKTIGFKAGKKPVTYTNPHPLKSLQTASNQVNENCYAVIISGGANLASNHWRYWNDSSFIYTTLTQVYGYADDHIYVLMSDGTDPSDDRHCFTVDPVTGLIIAEWYDSSPLDLDGDGDNDIDYAATKANIATVFNTLSGILGEDDYLFVFTTNHGGEDEPTDQDVKLYLWGESIRDDEFATEVNKISADCEAIMIMMEQCNSGGFVDDLIPGSQDRVIATACSATESSSAMPPDYYYDEFSYHWTCAVAWQNPEGAPVDADSDNNGQVSMTEAFDYAESHDTAAETPQYSESPAGIGLDLFLCSCMDPIDKGLKWLRTTQNPDGSWQNSVGITSMSALAFLNAGHTEDDPTVNKAIQYILANRNADGSFGWGTYETSLAVLALVATYNPDYNDEIADARDWLVDAQYDEGEGADPTDACYGGWRYGSSPGDGDLSNTQFALMALSAAGLPKGSDTWTKAITFTSRCQNRPASNDQAWADDNTRPSYNDGGFIYVPSGWSLAGGTKSYGSMTAAGIWSLRLCGVGVPDGRVQAGLTWLTNNEDCSFDDNPVMGANYQYYYYMSIAKALAMCFLGDLGGVDWYAALSTKLADLQHADGRWSHHLDDETTTDFALLALQTKQPPPANLWMCIILASNAELCVYDPQGRHACLGDVTIPGATFEIDAEGRQIVNLRELEAGKYRIVLKGTADGDYSLTIAGYRDDEQTSSETFEGTIEEGEYQKSDVLITSMVGALTIYAEEPEPLLVTDLVIEKSVTFEDGNFTVNYTVTNIGNSPAGASNTTIYIDSVNVLEDPVPPLASGDSFTNTVGPFDCPCDTTLNVTVCADNGNVVDESDETNNCEVNFVGCPPCLPDLVITNIWTVGNRVHYTIKNKGGIPTERSYSGLYIDGRYLARDRVDGLDPGESSTESFGRYDYTPGDTVKVCADYQDRIEESDETNNCREWKFEEGPDLVIEDKWEEWVNATHYTVTYVIHNKGTETAPACHNTTLYVDEVEIEHKHVPVDLAPCDTYKDTFTTAIELTGDSDTIKVCADNFNVVGEVDEKNNCLENVWPYIPEKKPDLVITDIELKDNKICYTIENQGGAAAGRSYTGLYIDGRYRARDSVNGLRPGESSIECFERYNYRGGEIEVCADYQDRIAEIDETNNCMEA